DALARLVEVAQKPVLLWSYTLPAQRSVALLSEAGLPLYTDIGNCARTLRLMAEYRSLRERFLSPIEVRSPCASAASEVREALAAAGPALCEWEARPILARYGIGTNALGTLSATAEEAVSALGRIGAPVALKVQSPDILHKTEACAVALGLTTPEEVRTAYASVLANARRHAANARILGVLVQPMAARGREIILGVKRDQTFGPLLMVGVGGVAVEVMKDVALAPVPLRADEARALLARLRGARLLDAHRGAPAGDVEALVDLMVRLGTFASDHADAIAEIDLNPVLVHAHGKGVSVVDALIVKGTNSPPLPLASG
ncbi:MAG TPA: acetate--CoA ligase family protein, partial [Hyphomicrobiaceae bacterium]|nr:acetate--CoA ligase family protein [Hyphomicrobiaceae bacterium]